MWVLLLYIVQGVLSQSSDDDGLCFPYHAIPIKWSNHELSLNSIFSSDTEKWSNRHKSS